ncbi:DDE-type integrase/transposase/recombinase [Planktomarina temperata]|nr:DDE-type integrase/transposase/recombinase [Planktomarina temperata]
MYSHAVIQRRQTVSFANCSKQYGQPRVLTTNELGSYRAKLTRLAHGIDHCAPKGLNNRAEISHRPTRRREKIVGRFKSPC